MKQLVTDIVLNLDGYTRIQVLYEGKHTCVLQAVRIHDGLKVVLKLHIDPQPGLYEQARIIKEYDTLKLLDGTGIARVLGKTFIGQRPVLIFENFDGISLSDFIKKGRIPISVFLEIAIKISDALHIIHGKKIMHKDINPNNIIINPETREIRIIDFGISATISRERTEIVNPNILEGTLAYISPEQTGRMNRSTDYRTDLYSLGITLFELVAGRPPFLIEDAMEMVHCHIAKPVPDISVFREDVPKVINDIIQKLASKIADDRYQTVEGLRNDLEKCKIGLKAGKIDYFTPGLSDRHSRFQISERLYGRENEILQLNTAFQEATNGGHPFVLISGYSGIGKTALIHELHKPSIEKKGYFVSGKYNQLDRNQPFSGIVQALRELLRQVLGEPKELLDSYKSKLLVQLGPNAGLIADLIPEIEILIGKTTEVQKLNPIESQNRFFFTFRDFLKVFADHGHPLALFLDDIQWADEASLGLIRELIQKEFSYFLLVGSYRSNELQKGTSLDNLISDFRKDNRALEIYLNPLEDTDVKKIVENTLSVTGKQADELSFLLCRKSGGSPFFLIELLKKLYESDLLRYSHAQDAWLWDIQEVQQLHVSGDVAEFMAIRILELPESCSHILQVASCIGNHFSLKMLSIQMQLTAEQALVRLMPAIQAELIYPLNDSYSLVTEDQDFSVSFRFQHDRIQQAAYHLLDVAARANVHLNIGRNLRDTYAVQALDDRIIEVVHNLNLGRFLIDDATEVLELCELNLLAGKRAHESVAFQAAFEYFKTGTELLPVNFWDNHYTLAFRLYSGLAQSAYLINQESLAESITADLLLRAKTVLDKVEILSVRLRQYTTTGKAADAIDTGVRGLKLLKIHISAQPSSLSVLREVLLAKWNLGKRKPSDLLGSPIMEHAEKIAAARLLTEIAPAAYVLGNDNLYGLLTLKVVNLSLRYGNSKESPYAYIAFGMVLKEAFGDLKAAYEFGQMALKLNETLGDLEYKCRVIAAYGVLTHHFNHHWKESRSFFQKAIESGFQSGDLFYLVHSAGNCLLWDPSLHLSELVYEYPHYLKIIADSGYKDALASNQVSYHFKRNLAGLTPNRFSLNDTDFDEDIAFQIMQDRNYYSGMGMYHIFKAEQYFVYEDYNKVFHHIVQADSYVKSLVSLPVLTRLCFITCITALRLMHDKQNIDSKYWKKPLQTMRKWSTYNPENFLHLFVMMEAEYYRYKDNFTLAAEQYQKGISLARNGNWLQDSVTFNILAGSFFNKHPQLSDPHGFYKNAMQIAEQWGAVGITRYIQEQYTDSIVPVELSQNRTVILDSHHSIYQSRNPNSSQTFDVSTIVKASQAISGEIRLESLLSKMMEIIMMNAGANKGILLLEQEGQLFIQAKAANGSIETMQNQLWSESSDLPTSLILYVSRLKEPVVLDHACEKGNFTKDSYILQNQTRSVICSPIILLNNLYGIILLENTLSIGAFTEDRLRILYLLSSQMAISIQNATLYSNLERKVEERTQELQLVNNDLQKAYSEIRAKNDNTIASITYAQRIQNALLPSEDKVRQSIKSSFVYYQPKDIVSGDFYWFSDNGNACFFAVGDCTGHGVPGAFMTLIANTLLNQIINENELYDPGVILTQLDKRLLQTLQQQSPNSFVNDGMDLTIICIQNGIITGASAKRPLLYIHNHELFEIKGSKYPIGSIFKEDKVFDTFQVPCTQGDMIYLFTDGYVDQFSPNKKKFMIRRFRDLLLSIHSLEMDLQKHELKKAFEAWKQNHFQLDDVLVAGIRV